MNNIVDLDKVGILRKIVDHYWAHCVPDDVGDLWNWLAQEYGAVNTQEGDTPLWNGGGQSYRVKFVDPQLQTLFLLKWL